MKKINRWSMDRKPLVRWLAEISPLIQQPAVLLDWMKHVLRAGAEHNVFIPVNAPRLNYTRSPGVEGMDPQLIDRLKELYEHYHILDVLEFANSGENAALLAYYDAEGNIVEREETELRQVLLRLRPDDVKHNPQLICLGSAVDIISERITYRQPLQEPYPGGLSVRVSIHSNLWLPWFYSQYPEDMEYEQPFNNLELACRHTPRLNAFLAQVKEWTIKLKGAWELNRSVIDPSLLNDDIGIRLDVQPRDGYAGA